MTAREALPELLRGIIRVWRVKGPVGWMALLSAVGGEGYARLWPNCPRTPCRGARTGVRVLRSMANCRQMRCQVHRSFLLQGAGRPSLSAREGADTGKLDPPFVRRSGMGRRGRRAFMAFLVGSAAYCSAGSGYRRIHRTHQQIMIPHGIVLEPRLVM